MFTPFFSVVIPMYNVENYIKATLRSVLNQTFKNFEVIVVNDGSTDSSCEIVSDIHDARIILINQENTGVAAARNAGIRKARGSYIAWLDSDDLWHPQHLEMAYLAFLQYPEVNWYASNYELISESKGTPELHTINSSLELLSYYSKRPGFVWSSSNIMKRNALPDLELFPTGMSYAEDGCAWAYFASKNPKLIYNSTVSAYYLQRQASAIHSLNVDKEKKYIKQEIEYFKKLIRKPNQEWKARLYQSYYIITKKIKYKEIETGCVVWSVVGRLVAYIFHNFIFKMK